MADEESEQTQTSEPADAAGAPKPKQAGPSSSPRWGKAIVPLALALGAAAIVYTLVTPNRGLEAPTPAAVDCSTAQRSVERALALGEIATARASFASAPAECRTVAPWQGSEAELLVLEGQVAQGSQLAARALEAQPKLMSARRVECLALLQAAENEAARLCFGKLLPDAADDLGTVFHGARAAQQAGKYRGAREGYLKALRLEPKHVEARYRLALMTHAIGAKGEAANHVRKLKQIARRDDPRLAEAERLLVAPAKTAGSAVPALPAAKR